VIHKTHLRLWQPPGETIEAIAAVLSSHWTAAKSRPETVFWPAPANWLRQQAARLARSTRFTSTPDSSPHTDILTA